MSSSSAAGRRSRARASFVIVRSRGSRPARSSSDTSVRCRLHAWPSASCDRPAASRAARRFVANCATGSTPVDAQRMRTEPLQTTRCALRRGELLSALPEDRARARGGMHGTPPQRMSGRRTARERARRACDQRRPCAMVTPPFAHPQGPGAAICVAIIAGVTTACAAAASDRRGSSHMTTHRRSR